MNGQNHYPTDIEETIRQSDPVLAEATVCVFASEAERPVALLEVMTRTKNIRGIVILTIHYQQLFKPPGDIQMAALEKPHIAAAQPRMRIISQTRLECFTRGGIIIPVPSGHTRST